MGTAVHGFHVAPEGRIPWPVIMRVHCGPTWLDLDNFVPQVQAYMDAGFAVGLVNYRGSIGWGREWRDAVVRDIGGPELDGVNAGLDGPVRRGIADPSRAVGRRLVVGWSVMLPEFGKHPDLCMCRVAGVPLGDYAADYQGLSPLLQALRRLLGGMPSEVPDLIRDSSPISFADEVPMRCCS